jgi:hypothetical protein
LDQEVKDLGITVVSGTSETGDGMDASLTDLAAWGSAKILIRRYVVNIGIAHMLVT